jgi:hypothetical protein
LPCSLEAASVADLGQQVAGEDRTDAGNARISVYLTGSSGGVVTIAA